MFLGKKSRDIYLLHLPQQQNSLVLTLVSFSWPQLMLLPSPHTGFHLYQTAIPKMCQCLPDADLAHSFKTHCKYIFLLGIFADPLDQMCLPPSCKSPKSLASIPLCTYLVSCIKVRYLSVFLPLFICKLLKVPG